MTHPPTIRLLPLQDYPLWLRARSQRIPLSFELEVTARCNNNCRHCFNNLAVDDEQARAAELSIEEIGHIAEEASSMGVLWVLLTGGEPLLRDDFSDIYLLFKKKGFLVSVFTNGTLVTPEIVDLFLAHPPRDVEVSVYGVTEATYERVTRRPGSFAHFMKGLGLMVDKGLPVRLKAMAMRANYPEIPEIGRFCRERTKDFYRFDPFLNLRYDGDAKRNAEIRRQRLSAEEIVALEGTDPARMKAVEKECMQLRPGSGRRDRSPRLFQCGIGFGSFAVSYDGSFLPCASLRHPDCVYDLRKGSLRDAWYSFTPRLFERTSDRPSFLAGCSECNLFNLCMWCPAHAYLETGELDGEVRYFCELAHARASAFSQGIPCG